MPRARLQLSVTSRAAEGLLTRRFTRPRASWRGGRWLTVNLRKRVIIETLGNSVRLGVGLGILQAVYVIVLTLALVVVIACSL